MEQNRQEFYRQMEQEVGKAFGDAYTVAHCSYKKLGWGEQEALCIRKQGDAFAPVIPMETPYRKFLGGASIAELAGDAVEIYTQSAKYQGRDIRNATSFLNDPESVRQRIFLHYVNTDQNRDMLAGLPHREILNLSLVYSILVKTEGSSSAFITINESVRQSYGWTEETLFQTAGRNMSRLFPATVTSLEQLVSKFAPDIEDAGQVLESVKNGIPFTIVQNRHGFYGFSAIFYPGVLKSLAGKNGGSLIVIPSSVHEAIIIQDDGEMPAGEISGMIREINGTQLKQGEQLSDRAYLYDREEDALFFLDDYRKGDKRVCVKL